MHMHAKAFVPDSSLLSMKMRYLSWSVRSGITTQTSPQSLRDLCFHFLHQCTHFFPHSSAERPALQQPLVPDGPQCQAPQILMIFCSKTGCSFVSSLTLSHWHCNIVPESSDYQQLCSTMQVRTDLTSTGNFLSSLQTCIVCISSL